MPKFSHDSDDDANDDDAADDDARAVEDAELISSLLIFTFVLIKILTKHFT